MVLAHHEIPVAYSMVELARKTALVSSQPFSEYTCYWTAFNNIYVTLAEYEGRATELKYNNDGSISTRPVAHVCVPKVKPVTEREQIDLAFDIFSESLKQWLIEHASTHFFVYRTPKWKGQPIQNDARGQKLNGVINISHTVSAEHPVWTPIDTGTYEQYMKGHKTKKQIDDLAKQIVDLLYTVRNNLFHGGKRADEANDIEVVTKAFPLLEKVVNSFLLSQ